MAWAAEMGSLVKNIQTSHRDRTHFVHNSKKETHELRAEAQRFLKETADDLKEMADGVRAMLNKSESSRMHDFKAMMEGIHGQIKAIQARVKEVRGDAHDFLAKSESTRRADFKTMMDNIADRIDEIQKRVSSVKHAAKALIGDYKAEHKEAAAHWASLPERHTEEVAAEEAASKPAHKAHKK